MSESPETLTQSLSQISVSLTDHGNLSFRDLPVELLILIFYPLRPTWVRTPNVPTKSDIHRFRLELKAFAQLRRLTIAVSQVITPALYEEVIIWAGASPSIATQGIDDLFAIGADYIKSVVLYGTLDSTRYRHKQSPRLPDKFEDEIGRGLGRCSQLRNLECYDLHPTFTHRNWLAKYAPSLSSTLRSLVIDVHKMNISYSLVGLGRFLETLEIRNWDSNISPSMACPLHLPSEMPNLKHVILRSSVPRRDDLKKLFERITHGRKSPNFLQSISFVKTGNLDVHDFSEILSINGLGNHLTSFRLEVSSPWHIHPSLLVDILKGCPNLLVFAYPAPAPQELLLHLPQRLQELEVVVVKEHMPFNPPMINLIPLLTYVKSRRASRLRVLSIVSPSRHVIDRTSLVSAFTQVGLRYQSYERLPQGGWRIRL